MSVKTVSDVGKVRIFENWEKSYLINIGFERDKGKGI